MGWKHHLFRKKEIWKTTWRFRVAICCVLALILVPTHRLWLGWIGRNLTHQDQPASADLIVIEYYSPNYMLFDKARSLMENGGGKAVIIPMEVRDGAEPSPVSNDIIDVLTFNTRLENSIKVPVEHREPITLNVARQVAVKLQEQKARSVTIVSPTFRSQRSYLVYRSVLEPLGIRVQCVHPVESRGPDNWWRSLHGIQDVTLEATKLIYYHIFVL
jgi:hypothetical protein